MRKKSIQGDLTFHPILPLKYLNSHITVRNTFGSHNLYHEAQLKTTGDYNWYLDSPLGGWIRLHEAVWLCGGTEVWTCGQLLLLPRFSTGLFFCHPSIYDLSNIKTMEYLQAIVFK